jgi:hypothetical protein
VNRRPSSDNTDHAFPDLVPIGIQPDGRMILLYVAVTGDPHVFRTFLLRHTPLCRAVPCWTLRIVLPRAREPAYETLQSVLRDEWETPLHPRTAEQLTRYFEQRRAASPAFERMVAPDTLMLKRPRFDALYRRWLKDGQSAFDEACSHVISEALATGAGRVELLLLPYDYRLLSPLVARVGVRPSGAEKRAEKGDTTGATTGTRPRPLPTEARIQLSTSPSDAVADDQAPSST